jgi:spore coat protein JC
MWLMWNYEKRLEFPVNIKEPNAKLAEVIISQYGGPDGEMGASMRYLSQRYAMPYKEVAGVLTDIGTEELAHLEMVATIVHQLTRNLSMEEIENSGFANYYVDHTVGVWPQAASGMPFSSATFQVTGDVITDLVEDMAAEQKARTTYDNILRLIKEPDVCEPIKFLREREIVHFQRFGEALRITQDKLDSKNFYAFNPAFDNKENCGCGKNQNV